MLEYFELEEFVERKDYCDSETEQWIWSIGEHKEDEVIHAAFNTRFYRNSDYECVWLR